MTTESISDEEKLAQGQEGFSLKGTQGPSGKHVVLLFSSIFLSGVGTVFMVIVKHFMPTVLQLPENPVFLYSHDDFEKPNSFSPDVVVVIDDVIKRKVDTIWEFESQIESLRVTGNFEKVVPVPTDSEERAARKKR